MADGTEWSNFFEGLPPLLQGAVGTVVVVAAGYATWTRIRGGVRGSGPQYTDLAVTEPTTFADMSNVKKLVEQVDRLTLQMMKSAVSTDSLHGTAKDILGKMGEACDLFAAHLADLREQREADEIEEARREGYESGLRARRPAPTKPRTRRKPE